MPLGSEHAQTVSFGPVLVSATRPRWIERLDEIHLLTPLRVLLILIVAWLLSLIVRRWVTRLVRRLLGLGLTSRLADERSSPRTRSLSSALRSAALATIWIVAWITAMDELGFDISGFVVTATVVGGALAFGAQTLVRDVIAGVFVLSEDQYAVGDVIDVGPIGAGRLIVGEVERISLRSTRLRDGEGRVWHVPNGAVLRVANLSKESRAVLDVELDRNADLAASRREISRLGELLRTVSSAAGLCAGVPSEVGVVALADDRLMLRSTIPTVPGRQGDVEHAWRELILGAYRRDELQSPG